MTVSNDIAAINRYHEICETEPAIERNVVPLKKKSSGSPAVDKAIEIVYGDRNEAYGPPEDDFLRIGRCWGAAIATWLGDDSISDIPPDVVAMMMIQLKTIRAIFKPSLDSHVDIIGYAVCSERCHDGFDEAA